MDLSRDALRHSGRMWRHTEDSGGGVMRFVCSLDRLQVVATRKAAEFGSPCPRRSQRPCSISSALLRGRTFQASTSRLISTLSSSLGANVEKYRRKFVDLDLINFRFWIRLGARWRSWVFGWKGDLCFRFDYSRKQWKKEIHLSSIAESYLNLRIMRSKERRRIY